MARINDFVVLMALKHDIKVYGFEIVELIEDELSCFLLTFILIKLLLCAEKKLLTIRYNMPEDLF